MSERGEKVGYEISPYYQVLLEEYVKSKGDVLDRLIDEWLLRESEGYNAEDQKRREQERVH